MNDFFALRKKKMKFFKSFSGERTKEEERKFKIEKFPLTCPNDVDMDDDGLPSLSRYL